MGVVYLQKSDCGIVEFVSSDGTVLGEQTLVIWVLCTYYNDDFTRENETVTGVRKWAWREGKRAEWTGIAVGTKQRNLPYENQHCERKFGESLIQSFLNNKSNIKIVLRFIYFAFKTQAKKIVDK